MGLGVSAAQRDRNWPTSSAAVDGQLVGVRGEMPGNPDYIGAAEPLAERLDALSAKRAGLLERGNPRHIAHLPKLPPGSRNINDPERA